VGPCCAALHCAALRCAPLRKAPHPQHGPADRGSPRGFEGPGNLIVVEVEGWLSPITPHTLKNSHEAEVRLINVHKPALAFERFFRRFHALVSSGRLKLPPKNLGSVILISMLFQDHPKEIISVKPSRTIMRVMAFLGTVLRYELPP